MKDEWKTMPLGEFAESVDYGVTASATEQPLGPKFLRITDIQDGAVNWGSVPWCECDTRSASDARLKAGDSVFARTGATTGKSFLIRDCPTDAVFASYLIRVRVGTSAEPRFVSHFFQTENYWAQVAKGARGVAQPGVNATTLKALQIPLPPLAEQRRIAEVLDRAEALRAKRCAALAQLDSLTQSLFLDLFGDDGANPKKWPVRAVADYVREFQGGKSIESESGENVTTRNRVLKVSAVTGMKFLAHESKPVPDSYEPPKEHFAKPGDLLFSRANTTELVGAVAYVESTPPNVLLPDKLWRFVWRDPAAIEPLFVWALFQTAALRREIGRRATGTSGSMKNISQEKLFGIHTILPPISLQREFARRVTAVEALKTAQRASLAELDAIFATLQHRAFRGEL
jgi:type I restriction enzyme S subunit